MSPLARSCVTCGARVESGASRCPTHTTTRTHDDAEYRRNRRIAFARDRERCVFCRRTPTDGAHLEVDHIVPLGLGGTHELKNLRVVCSDCHDRGGQ